MLEDLEELLNNVTVALREHLSKLQDTSDETSANYYQKLSAYIKWGGYIPYCKICKYWQIGSFGIKDWIQEMSLDQ